MSVKKIILLLFVCILIFSATGILLFHNASKTLTYHHKIPSNVLVVEGWISDRALLEAYNEFVNNKDYEYLIVTGNQLDKNHFLYINSFLIFHPGEVITGKNHQGDSLLIELEVESTLGINDSAQFVFWINDEAIAEYYTYKHTGSYIIKLDINFDEIDSLMIQFTNDKVSESGDRNLMIKQVKINGEILNYKNSQIFQDTGRPFGKNRRNLTTDTYAGLAAHYFIQMGIPSDQVIPVPNCRSHLRRTYGNAKSLREWFKNTEIKSDIQGINVVTMDYHSYRTWKTYKKLLRNVSDVGIISFNDASLNNNEALLKNKKIKETLAIVYYWVFILPWI